MPRDVDVRYRLAPDAARWTRRLQAELRRLAALDADIRTAAIEHGKPTDADFLTVLRKSGTWTPWAVLIRRVEDALSEWHQAAGEYDRAVALAHQAAPTGEVRAALNAAGDRVDEALAHLAEYPANWLGRLELVQRIAAGRPFLDDWPDLVAGLIAAADIFDARGCLIPKHRSG